MIQILESVLTSYLISGASAKKESPRTSGAEKTPKKAKVVTTPQRNTLDKWIIKTPKTAERPAPGSGTSGSSTFKTNASKPEREQSKRKSVKDLEMKHDLKKLSPSHLESSVPSPSSLISSETIRKLENAPIIVDLESESDEEKTTPSLASSSAKSTEMKTSTKSKQIEVPSLLVTPAPVEEPVKQVEFDEKVVTTGKRPATSPLSSQQKSKQPRRVQLITLSSAPKTLDSEKSKKLGGE
jgi:hypothetical protein